MKQNLVDLYVQHTRGSIENAHLESSKITKESGVLDIDGMSSRKVRHVLNNICSLSDTRYLEIGAWKGSTLISALYENNHVKATCIENFSDFNGPRDTFHNNVRLYSSQGKIPSFQFIDADCFAIDTSVIEKKNCYFFDGGHEVDDHVRAFTYYNGILDDTFICVVDDWNHKYDNVRIGTKRAFKELNYKVHYEAELPAKFNGDRELWWNGLYIAVVTK